MLAFLIRRIMQSVVLMLVLTVLTFLGTYSIGNPVDIFISPRADQATRQAAIEALGLDRPIWEQYLTFLGNLLQGDLGRSFFFNRPAVEIVTSRLTATLELATCAMLLAIIVGVPLGLIAGMKYSKPAGKSIMATSIVGFSLPSFWVGVMLILTFSVILGWLPAGGRGPTREILGLQLSVLSLEGLSHIILPSVNLALFNAALIIRVTQAHVRETLSTDYIKFAQAKGLRNRRILFVHVLKPVLIPLITVLGMEFGGLVAYSVVTETIFAWPGIGKLIVDAIFTIDRPVIVVDLLFVAMIYVIVNMIVDILYSVLDPRVRQER